MTLGKNRLLGQFKWHLIVIYIALAVTILLTLFTNVFRSTEGNSIPQAVWLLVAFVLLVALTTILSVLYKVVGAVEDVGAKLEKVSEAIEKNRTVLGQINQSSRLTETTRAIAFREIDRQTLRDAVFEKLQQQDFDSTYEIIEEIANSTGYQELAKQLRAETDRYRDATDTGRATQVISHINKLFETHEWAKASAHIERLIRTYPRSDKAKAMRRELIDKKEERKKILLTAWDDAVTRRATDRSIEILRELDSYLTPNEAMALQEAARDVFRSKLHGLGVRFSLAVSGRQWKQALKTGLQITRDFPNSKMSGEIREKMDVLQQKVLQ